MHRVYTWREGTGEGVTGLKPGGRIKEERRWFCVPVFLFLWMGQASGSWRRVSGGKESGKVPMSATWWFFPWTGRRRRGRYGKKELLVLFLRKGQASGSWRRVSGGKESGKVSRSATWRFFSFLWTGRRRRRPEPSVYCWVPDVGLIRRR